VRIFILYKKGTKLQDGVVNMNKLKEIKTTLKHELQKALLRAAQQKELELNEDRLPEFDIERPREKEHGDYASNLALIMGGQIGISPRELAEKITDFFTCEYVDRISVAGPGFINFKLKNDWLYEVLDLILELEEDYGSLNYGQGESVLLEFVSANPTGPLHIGHSRGAVTGDVLAAILKKAGYDVHKEYYVNDVGNQIEILARSTFIRYKQELGENVSLPEDCYAGDYLVDIARELQEKYGSELNDLAEEKSLEICREYTLDTMLEMIEEDLKSLGVNFDCWYKENQLHQGKIKEAVNMLKDRGYIYKKEGAVWFEASAFFDEKDRVVIKSDGTPTYLAADIAYHYHKLERGFDSLINIWGADHHGYVPRIKSVIEALGEDPESLEVIIVQLVSLMRKGEKISMSKRSGDFVTLRDLLQEVGRDVARFFYIMRSSDSHLDFDLDLALEQSKNNPVYYIQYAHARIHSIMENLQNEQEIKQTAVDPTKLNSAEEIDLMKVLAHFPEEIKFSAVSRQPHHIASYASELAEAFHVFYNKRRVITDDKELSAARVYLVKAVRQVLKNVLSLMGMEAPRQM